MKVFVEWYSILGKYYENNENEIFQTICPGSWCAEKLKSFYAFILLYLRQTGAENLYYK